MFCRKTKIILCLVSFFAIMSCEKDDYIYEPVFASGRLLGIYMSVTDAEGNDLLTDPDISIEVIGLQSNLSKKYYITKIQGLDNNYLSFEAEAPDKKFLINNENKDPQCSVDATGVSYMLLKISDLEMELICTSRYVVGTEFYYGNNSLILQSVEIGGQTYTEKYADQIIVDIVKPS